MMLKTCSYQLNDFNQHPIVSRAGHQLEEQRCKRQIVLWILPRQLTNNIYCC